MHNRMDSSVIDTIVNMTEKNIEIYAEAMANSFINNRTAYENILYVIGGLLSIYAE